MNGTRYLMVLMGFYTPVHASLVALLLASPWIRGASAVAALAGLGLLYLFPPFAARGVLALWGPPGPGVALGSGPFFRWWALSQLQLVFNRLPLLEELLRLVPGLYSAWLRLWGARVGRYVFWSPGVVIADRYLLEVGDQVVVGMGARIVSHVIVDGDGGGRRLLAAPVVIGSHAVVGGFSTLGPGCRIADGESPPALVILPPFSVWNGARRWSRRTAGGDPR